MFVAKVRLVINVFQVSTNTSNFAKYPTCCRDEPERKAVRIFLKISWVEFEIWEIKNKNKIRSASDSLCKFRPTKLGHKLIVQSIPRSWDLIYASNSS